MANTGCCHVDDSDGNSGTPDDVVVAMTDKPKRRRGRVQTYASRPNKIPAYVPYEAIEVLPGDPDIDELIAVARELNKQFHNSPYGIVPRRLQSRLRKALGDGE